MSFTHSDDADGIEGPESEIARHRGTTKRRIAGAAVVVGSVVLLGWGYWIVSGRHHRAIVQPAYSASTAAVPPLAAPVDDPPDAPAKANSLPPPGGEQSDAIRQPVQLAIRKDGVGADKSWIKLSAAVSDPAGSVAAGTQDSGQTDKTHPGVFDGPRAWINQHPELTIPSHTKIHCLPDGPITSEVEGPLTCVVQQPVYAEAGTVPLIDPGSEILGSITHGVSNGATRLYVELEMVRTPQHARIPFKGTGADALGENGIPGNLDPHLMRRLGAGVAMAVIEGGIQAGVSIAGSSGQRSNVLQQFGSPVENEGNTLAQTVLGHDINIPDTLVHPQGDEITVVTIGDIDLSSIYQLRLRGN